MTRIRARLAQLEQAAAEPEKQIDFSVLTDDELDQLELLCVKNAAGEEFTAEETAWFESLVKKHQVAGPA